jgi:hypothetical protein
MNHARVSFFMVMLMLPLLGHAQQVAYDYDASGNRTGRSLMTASRRAATENGYRHGLAIAMTDESDKMNRETAKNTCKNKSVPFSPSEWVLPSDDQWCAMFQANGGNRHNTPA